MTIKEMKAKGFKRYSAYIKKLIFTEEIEVWARNIEDAYKIFKCSADELFGSSFADREYTEVQGLTECKENISIRADGQTAFTNCNEDFYKSEKK